MSGITNILDIGSWALFGNQAAIENTGNNIANVNTEGYTRRTVRFEEKWSIDFRPGQLGTGSEAAEVIRHFDEFIEAQFHDKYSLQTRYETLWENLNSVDSLVDESSTEGIQASMTEFFNSWQTLSLHPDDYSSREALLGKTQNLTSLLNNTDGDLQDLQRLSEASAQAEVEHLNELLHEIADVNEQISIHHIEGVNNANSLFDKRDMLVREVSELVDVQVIDKSAGTLPQNNHSTVAGDWHLLTKSGYTLVQGQETFEVAYEGPQAFQTLSNYSNFDGDIAFDGASSFEYTVEVVTSGNVNMASSAGTSNAQFRVSMDGGQTWLKDENGNVKIFEARPEDGKVDVQGVEVWFENNTQGLTAGDEFTIMPKDGIYWYETTAHKVNITPQVNSNGTDNTRRLTGGSLAAHMEFAGPYVGTYRDKLDALTKTFIWETNRIHSQGTGLEKFKSVTGTYDVNDPSMALGSDSSGLFWNDKLTEGNLVVYFYESSTDTLSGSSAYGSLDFDPNTPGVIDNFDPTQHSLSDVAAAFNASFPNHVTASIVDNRLSLTTKTGFTMGFGTDTTGLLAGLGINTYFEGTSSSDIALNSDILNNTNRINAGHINGAGEANVGDNTTALSMGQLINKSVTITGVFDSGSTQTMIEYYGTLVATVGSDTASAEFTFQYNQSLADDLNTRQQSLAGVNLDEEMSDLIKYQNSYRAAAKLISTADQMLQTVLGLKQ